MHMCSKGYNRELMNTQQVLFHLTINWYACKPLVWGGKCGRLTNSLLIRPTSLCCEVSTTAGGAVVLTAALQGRSLDMES